MNSSDDMADPEKRHPNLWLFLLGALFLFYFVFFGQNGQSLDSIRWGGFFLLAQILPQIIFPRFQCSKTANLNMAILIIVGTIILF